MCILAMAWRAHPRWHLVLAGNRDELHARPAAALARWDDSPHLIAGRDLQSGGTWLGVSDQGRMAVITNLRSLDGAQPDRMSRGALVTDQLSATGRYADPGLGDLMDFNPFNLIVADRGEARFLTNRPRPLHTALTPGLYGLSNGALDEPWAKTLQLKASLLEWLVDGANRPEALFDALRSETLPKAGIEPREPSDAPLEPWHSPIFIRNPRYGTRCSTIVAIDTQGKGLIIERRFDADGAQTGESRIDFAWRL
jgi:uncharacterized protein with NRDE domain